MDSDEEQKKIEEVYFEIKREGPLTIEDLVQRNLESEEHLRRITKGLDRAGKISATEDGWIAR